MQSKCFIHLWSFFSSLFFFIFIFLQKDAAYVNIYTIPFQDNKPLVSSDSRHQGHDRIQPNPPKITSAMSVVCQGSLYTANIHTHASEHMLSSASQHQSCLFFFPSLPDGKEEEMRNCTPKTSLYNLGRKGSLPWARSWQSPIAEPREV